NGKVVTKELFRQMLAEEREVVRKEIGEERWQNGKFEQATQLLDQITTSDELVDFLTLPAYQLLG
ncbi:MAG: malate synthase A, partial [Pseudomonadales bacterium]|nr:malate synthase A [Pseudomonadales bacterium]